MEISPAVVTAAAETKDAGGARVGKEDAREIGATAGTQDMREGEQAIGAVDVRRGEDLAVEVAVEIVTESGLAATVETGLPDAAGNFLSFIYVQCMPASYFRDSSSDLQCVPAVVAVIWVQSRESKHLPLLNWIDSRWPKSFKVSLGLHHVA
jgi:hypothetical protein